MPPKGKHKNANQHEKRHDAGLAAPGKRISKDKSSTHVNGIANGKPSQSAVPPPLPSTGLNQGLVFPRPVSTSGPSDKDVSTSADDQAETSTADRKSSGTIDAKVQGADTSQGDMARSTQSPAADSEPRAGSETAQTIKTIAAQVNSSISLAATILSSCPLRDAIAILILLLSLPPPIILFVHTLFASLTFVPPTVGLSLASLASFPTITDLFQATPGGGPSPFTILLTDAPVVFFYMIVPWYVKGVFMDLGHLVISISLSGATAARGTSTHSVFFCSAIIFVSHLVRYQSGHLNLSDYIRPALKNMGLDLPSTFSTPVFASRSSEPSRWLRLCLDYLGCHILAQGLLTLVRRWVARANQTRTDGKTKDPEAATLGDGTKASVNGGEGSTPADLSTTCSDSRTVAPSPPVRDSKERVQNTKKKRKQGNLVRSQQPLWAAIASTKVTFMKEMEQKQVSNDALEAGAMSNSSAGYGALPSTEDRIWITGVHSTDISFRADISAGNTEHLQSAEDDAVPPSPGAERARPLLVRLNGADWGSIRLIGATSNDQVDGLGRKVWHGEIHGLTARTSYSCEFLRPSDHETIYKASLVTLAAPNTEQTSNVPSPQHSSLRPLSPTSTLKQSIAAAEVKREEMRNKVKRNRRDHKNAAAAVRKEIDQLSTRVSSSGGQDDRQKQRILQLKQHVKQAEDATVAFKTEMDALGEIPSDELEAYAAKKGDWETANEAKTAAAGDLDKSKAEANKEVLQVHAELASLAQKRERLTARIAKIHEQHDRLRTEQHAHLSARQRHEEERARLVNDRSEQESKLAYWIMQNNKEAEDMNIRANEMFQQADYASSQLARRQAGLSRAPTPEGDLPGTNGHASRSAQNYDFQPFPMVQSQGSLRTPWASGNVVRGRSSSMLSAYSGFTDELDLPQSMNDEQQLRKRSDESPVSAGSAGGDQMSSPRPFTKFLNPIGPPSGAEEHGNKAAGIVPWNSSNR